MTFTSYSGNVGSDTDADDEKHLGRRPIKSLVLLERIEL